MIIRELITLFGFEVDEKGAKNVEKKTKELQKGIGGLGKTIAASIGVVGAKSFLNLGQTAERAEFNMARLSGLSYKKLLGDFENIKTGLDDVKEGAGDLVKKRQYDIAGAGFFKTFGNGATQIKTFNKLFLFSAKQAAITGKSVVDIFAGIQDSISGGGFEGFLDLPGFDVFKKQLLEFQQAAIDPGEPGGKIAIQNRLKAVIGIIAKSTESQNVELKKIPQNLLEVDRATGQTKESVDKLAKATSKALTPAMKGLNVVLGETADLLDVTSREHKSAFNLIFPGVFDLPETPEVVKPISGVAPDVAEAFPGQTPISGDTITMTNTFIMQSTDPLETSKEVTRALQNELLNVKRSIVKTEE